jgi:hypothetical protein
LRIQEFAAAGLQAFPQGGSIMIGGIHVPLGPWLAYAKAQRVMLHHNIPQQTHLFERIQMIERMFGQRPELVFVSPMLQLSSGLPGTVQAVPMQLQKFWQMDRKAPSPAPGRPVRVGKHCADHINKHHPQDMALYRSWVARGLAVRIMGGTCLSSGKAEAGIELLPIAVSSSEDFLRGIDIYFYRTQWAETYGRVIFEALASGLPVVAQSHAGYTAYLEHGREIELVSTQEQAYEAVLAIAQDAALYRSRSDAGKKASQRVYGADWLDAVLKFYLA